MGRSVKKDLLPIPPGSQDRVLVATSEKKWSARGRGARPYFPNSLGRPSRCTTARSSSGVHHREHGGTQAGEFSPTRTFRGHSVKAATRRPPSGGIARKAWEPKSSQGGGQVHPDLAAEGAAGGGPDPRPEGGAARIVLRTTNKRIAPTVLKVLESAIANATNRFEDLDVDRLYVTEAYVNEGRARNAYGRRRWPSLPVPARQAHIVIKVAEKEA